LIRIKVLLPINDKIPLCGRFCFFLRKEPLLLFPLPDGFVLTRITALLPFLPRDLALCVEALSLDTSTIVQTVQVLPSLDWRSDSCSNVNLSLTGKMLNLLHDLGVGQLTWMLAKLLMLIVVGPLTRLTTVDGVTAVAAQMQIGGRIAHVA
jgi:hypothetical protein